MLFKQAELWMPHQGKHSTVSMPAWLPQLPLPPALLTRVSLGYGYQKSPEVAAGQDEPGLTRALEGDWD